MSPLDDPATDRAEARRWAACFGVVVAVHALPVAVVAGLGLIPSSSPPHVSEPAILIDLPPPAAPPLPPSERPPGPRQLRAAASQARLQDDPVRTPPVPDPAVALPASPPQPQFVAQKQAAPETTAPPVHPLPPAPQPSATAVTWQGLVLGRLEKFKRYPSAAQAARREGTPFVRFQMDRDGKVLTSQLERSSGVGDLDAEAVALPRRAQPFPRPPPDIEGDPVELVVPVEFFINRRR